jgi:hypothetical protein
MGGRDPSEQLVTIVVARILDHLGVAARSDLRLGFAVSRAVFVTQAGNLG